jgi:anthranilate synthase component 2
MREPRVLVLDNRDSFVFNLVDELRARGSSVVTVRSDLDRRVRSLAPHLVVLSPGPGRPEESKVMLEWLASDPEVPVLGVCLGHQALAVAAGGEVGPAPRPVHGQSYPIEVDPEEPAFAGIRGVLFAARYHSLVVTRVPPELKVVATALDSGRTLVMGLRHRTRCRLGLQFHPESILTPHGREVLYRFLDEAVALGERR